MINHSFIIILFSLTSFVVKAQYSSIIDTEYVAIKYSVFIDLDGGLFTGEFPSTMNAQRYFIKYGRDSIIELSDPGGQVEYLPIVVHYYDYANKVINSKFIMNFTEEVRLVSLPIEFSVEEHKGFVEQLCGNMDEETGCDSVKYTSDHTKSEFIVVFDKSKRNLRAHKLFYPDIEYLPTYITKISSPNGTLVFDDIIYGKDAIDSILEVTEHKGFYELTDEDMEKALKKNPPESYMHLVPGSTK